MAAAQSFAQASRPWAACISPSAPSEPGTDTLRGPRTAIPSGNASGVAARGAGPQPL